MESTVGEDAGTPVVGAAGLRAAGSQRQGMENKLLTEGRKIMDQTNKQQMLELKCKEII